MIVVLTAVLIVVAACAAALVLEGRTADPLVEAVERDDALRGEASGENPDHLRARAQLIAVEIRHGCLVLDAIILEQADLGSRRPEAGAPVTFRLSAPNSTLISSVVTGIVAGWADEMRVAELSLDGDTQMMINCDDTRVQLDLEEAIGIG